MADEKEKKESLIDKIIESYEWTIKRLERTILFGIRFVIPNKIVSPHGFLGMLTFITFIVLGVTGVLLMFYYRPSLTDAYDSVKLINDEIDFGVVIRNIHYHASNLMIFLAIYHLFYQLFSSRYKIRNEVIWVTGVILGTLTIVEAYIGYDLIMNIRAVLAINIGAALTYSTPFIGPLIANVVIGTGFNDLILRIYTLHVLLFPMVMIILFTIHFPRNLVFDPGMVGIIVGALFVTSALFPVPLGEKYSPDIPAQVTVPEWYINPLYALLRTELDKFLMGVLLPTLFIFMFMIVPFIDRKKSMKISERPIALGIGVSGVLQSIVTTVWGFYVDPDPRKSYLERIAIDPYLFFGVLILINIVSFGGAYLYSKYHKKLLPPPKRTRSEPININPETIEGIVYAMIIVEFFVVGVSLYMYMLGNLTFGLLATGLSLIIFGFISYGIRLITSR